MIERTTKSGRQPSRPVKERRSACPLPHPLSPGYSVALQYLVIFCIFACETSPMAWLQPHAPVLSSAHPMTGFSIAPSLTPKRARAVLQTKCQNLAISGNTQKQPKKGISPLSGGARKVARSYWSSPPLCMAEHISLLLRNLINSLFLTLRLSYQIYIKIAPHYTRHSGAVVCRSGLLLPCHSSNSVTERTAP